MSTKSCQVTALPSCHFRPVRSFNEIDRLSGASCQDSARSGLALPVPSFQSKREKTWSYISKLTAEKFQGLKLLKSPASAYVKVPPFLAGETAAWAGVAWAGATGVVWAGAAGLAAWAGVGAAGGLAGAAAGPHAATAEAAALSATRWRNRRFVIPAVKGADMSDPPAAII